MPTHHVKSLSLRKFPQGFPIVGWFSIGKHVIFHRKSMGQLRRLGASPGFFTLAVQLFRRELLGFAPRNVAIFMGNIMINLDCLGIFNSDKPVL